MSPGTTTDAAGQARLLTRLTRGIGVMRVRSHVLQSPLAAPREGVMLHYDDSSRDDWSLDWFHDARCTNGYTWLVLDDGTIAELADPRLRTPHAGACRVPHANSRYYGISAATNGLVPATPAQLDAIVALIVVVYRAHGWTEPERIVGHDAMAVWTPETTRAAGMPDERGRALWGRTGRKADPTGVRPDGVPIIGVADVRDRVASAFVPAAQEAA
jgi:N-acetyl-anhydromuramyl-L-alanine amidase AmpD